jgi:uncharacterized protein Usg
MGYHSSDLAMQIQGYRLTTAEILYRMPDFPDVLQSFIWQNLDLAPRFPVLKRFLDFWSVNIDGKLHSVKIAHTGIVSPAELRMVNSEFSLH